MDDEKKLTVSLETDNPTVNKSITWFKVSQHELQIRFYLRYNGEEGDDILPGRDDYGMIKEAKVTFEADGNPTIFSEILSLRLHDAELEPGPNSGHPEVTAIYAIIGRQ